MEILCTRPGCSKPQNFFPDLDDTDRLKTAQQKYCTSCGMPLILGGRYLPSKLLGQGGFGAAFLACDRFTASLRQCVVKQFKPSGDLSPQQLETARGLFEREATILEELGNDHKQIPNSYAFFPIVTKSSQGDKEEQFFYLVQEYIDGQDLEVEQAQRGRVYSEQEVREILTEILPVLQFVHKNGSIHRDIKPSNIMRSRKGRLYLLDFGAVKQVTAGAGAVPGRSTGIYSMGFAPPEQMQGAQVYPSTDLYALATTCLVLLTNTSPEELFDSYQNSWKWRDRAPQVSHPFADILDRMLLPSPKDRFQSVQEVLAALQRTAAAPTQPPPLPKNPPPPQAPVLTQPPPPSPSVARPPQPIQPSQPRFSLLEVFSSAAFVGFEGAMLFLALGHFVAPAIQVGVVGATVGGLIYAQYRRILEGKDLPILALLSLAVLLGLLFWQTGSVESLIFALVVSALTAVAAIAVTALFRLIYQLLSRFL